MSRDDDDDDDDGDGDDDDLTWLLSTPPSQEAFAQKYYGLDACMANLMRPGVCALRTRLRAMSCLSRRGRVWPAALFCRLPPGMYEAYHYISVPAREGDDAATRGKAHVVGTLASPKPRPQRTIS